MEYIKLSTITMDKFKRNLQKYGSIKPFSYFRKTCYCMGFLLIIVTLCWYFEYFSIRIGIIQQSHDQIVDENLVILYSKFLKQLNLARNDPTNTMKDTLILSAADSAMDITRTKTIQCLYDYVTAATKALYTDHHHLQCILPLTGSKWIEYNVTLMEIAVRQFIETNNYSIYKQNITKQYIEKRLITKGNCDGLCLLEGEFGAFATKNIPQNTCIAVYYGDEYLLQEFKSQYPANIYPKKWNYSVEIPYDILALKGLNIDETITVTINGYLLTHDSHYNAQIFINDARRWISKPDLTEQDLDRKNVEFLYCSLDGVLIPFIVTTSDIQANRQLFAYYGTINK